MNPFGILLVLVAQLLPPPPAGLGPGTSFGPTPPPLKGLHRPLPLAAGVPEMVRATLRDLGGSAVVVVEDDMPLPMPKLSTGLQLFGGNLRLFRPVLTPANSLPVLPWMDTSTVRSGPNVAARSYPLGWGY